MLGPIRHGLRGRCIGDAAPLRLVGGVATALATPAGVALDSSDNLYVTSYNSNAVNVFSPGADGNVAPVHRLVGAGTQLAHPFGIHVDSARRLVVANSASSALTAYAPLVPLAKPGKVMRLKVTGKPAAAKRKVTWQPPASDGGARIARYKVVVKKGHKRLVKATVLAPKHSLKLKRKQLTTGVLTVYVKAKNSVGYGPQATKRFRVR